MALTSIDKF